MEAEMNWLALLTAAASALVIGSIYYHPKVFGNAWMKSAGLNEEKLKGGNMVVILGGAFVLAFILAFFIFFSIESGHSTTGENLGHKTFGHGMIHGIILAVMTAVPVIVVNGMFERKKAMNNLLHVGYWILTYAIMAGIVDAWR